MSGGICAECGFVNDDPTDYLCEGCRAKMCGCKVVPTMGVVDANDPRFFGGHVSERTPENYPAGGTELIRHDPMRHAKDCIYLAK